MAFTAEHRDELFRAGYTVVRGAIEPHLLRAAQDAAEALNAQFPEGWERSKNESWREIRYCRHPAFMAVVAEALDPPALEILDSTPTVGFVQLAATFPGFARSRRPGRGRGRSPAPSRASASPWPWLPRPRCHRHFVQLCILTSYCETSGPDRQ
jgi:hypothetical protein